MPNGENANGDGDDSALAKRVHISLTAFQDFHRLMPRVASRAHLRRLAQKLVHWEPGVAIVLDYDCTPIGEETGLFDFLVNEISPSVPALRLTFFEFFGNEPNREIWVISGSSRLADGTSP